jgi:hypothetical protein
VESQEALAGQVEAVVGFQLAVGVTQLTRFPKFLREVRAGPTVGCEAKVSRN